VRLRGEGSEAGGATQVGRLGDPKKAIKIVSVVVPFFGGKFL